MKSVYYVPLLLFSFSCSSQENSLLEINPENWIENNITMADISDDISYISMDNSYPFQASPDLLPQINGNSIFLFIGERNKVIGRVEFNREGKMIRTIGDWGRGPGEYMSKSFAVDDKTGTVYILDGGNKIKVYSKSGDFKREILLKNYEGFYPNVDVYNSKLIVSSFLLGGSAKLNWIVLDTLGNLIKMKENSIPPFSDNIGRGGGTFKYDKKLFYWNLYNDTVFSILPDLSYKAALLFSPGRHRWPRSNIDISLMSDYLWPHSLFETNRFLILYCTYNKKNTFLFIEKKNKKTYLAYRKRPGSGLLNDIDGGLSFDPYVFTYFVENDHEYMIGFLDSYNLKNHVASDEFKNSEPKYPEKKKELEKLANSLSETDNPILMLVKLKK